MTGRPVTLSGVSKPRRVQCRYSQLLSWSLQEQCDGSVTGVLIR